MMEVGSALIAVIGIVLLVWFICLSLADRFNNSLELVNLELKLDKLSRSLDDLHEIVIEIHNKKNNLC